VIVNCFSKQSLLNLERAVDHMIQFRLEVPDGFGGNIYFNFEKIDIDELFKAKGVKLHLKWSNSTSKEKAFQTIFFPTLKIDQNAEQMGMLFGSGINKEIKEELAKHIGIEINSVDKWNTEVIKTEKKISGEDDINANANFFVVNMTDIFKDE
jgi:hypothetical protein